MGRSTLGRCYSLWFLQTRNLGIYKCQCLPFAKDVFPILSVFSQSCIRTDHVRKPIRSPRSCGCPLYTVIPLWADRDITHQACVYHRVILNFGSNWSSVLGVLWCHNILLTDMSQRENAVMYTCHAHVISTVVNYSANMHNLNAVYSSALCTTSYHNTAVILSNVYG